MHCLNTYQVRRLDSIAQERLGIPGLLLMEHASLGIAEVLVSCADSDADAFLILCGRGNNGGDGFAVARQLSNRGFAAVACLVGTLDRLREGSDARINAQMALRFGIPVLETPEAGDALAELDRRRPDHIVDALIGTGLSSEVRGSLREIIDGLNERELDVTAVDVPSGLDADTGRPLGTAVRATRTVTLAFQKEGLTREEARPWCGEVTVSGIGLPRAVIEDPWAYIDEAPSEG